MPTQKAIFHGAGECSSVLLVSVAASDSELSQARHSLVERAARLMRLLETENSNGPAHAPDNLHVLVAVSTTVLAAPAGLPFTEFPVEGLSFDERIMQRGDGSADVLVQVSAPNETDRRYALRLACDIFRGYGAREPMPATAILTTSEVHGARILSGLEPFGYRDGSPAEAEGLPPDLMVALRELQAAQAPPREWPDELRKRGLLPAVPLADPLRAVEIFQRALADDAERPRSPMPRRRPALPRSAAEQAARRNEALEPLRRLAQGDVWLLYQRFEHALGALAEIDPDRDVGKAPVGGSVTPSPAPANSHLAIAEADVATIHRRGFAYRNDKGVEGLVFIGLAAQPESFQVSLTRHLETDRLFSFTRAVASGIYRVPQSADWLADQAGVDHALPSGDPIPLPARQLMRPRSSKGRIPRLVNYQVIPEVIQYIQTARAFGLFLEPSMELNPSAEAALQALESNIGGGQLTALRETIREQSEALYNYNGGYFTLSV